MDFYTSLFIYGLAKHSFLTDTPFFIDKYILRELERKYFGIDAKPIFRLIFYTSGSIYFESVHKGLNFRNFKFISPSKDTLDTNQFSDKLIVLDFGASWCSPCKEQLPYLLEAIKSLESRSDIVFISVSIDKSINRWKENLPPSSNHTNHIHGLIPSNELRKFKTYYNLTSIPKYFFIAPSGEVITYEGPKPQSGIFKELINRSFNEQNHLK